MTPVGKYNIKAISTIVGIQPGTLRAWERRYHIIKPIRNEAGHRLYSEEHVQIVKWLVHKVNEGFTIGQAVNLYEKTGEENSLDDPIQLDRSEVLVNNLVNSLLKLEEVEANRFVDEAFSLYSIEKVLFDVLLKALNKICDMRIEKQIRSSHEYFANSFLRTRVGVVFQHTPVNASFPKIMFVCGPSEMKDVGLLILATFFRRRGFQVVYIGASLDIEDMEAVLSEVIPKGLVMSCTMLNHLQEAINIIKEIKRQFPDLKIALSNNAELENPENKEFLQLTIDNSIEALEKWIEENLSF